MFVQQVEPVLIYGEKRLAAPGIETEFHLEDRRFVEQVGLLLSEIRSKFKTYRTQIHRVEEFMEVIFFVCTALVQRFDLL